MLGAAGRDEGVLEHQGWSLGLDRPIAAGDFHFGHIERLRVAERQIAPSTLRTIFRDLRAKDQDLYSHGHRVAVYATVIGGAMGLSDERVSNLAAGAWLHDLGKIHIPGAIRFKEGRLTQDEYAVMQQHPSIGARILRAMGAKDYAYIALHHHEWYAGLGYPTGIAGSGLDLESQITSVADAYDAMTVNRCYRNGRSHECAMTEIAKFSGIQFCPEVVRTFMALSSHIDRLKVLLVNGNPSVSDLNLVQALAG